MNYLLVFLLFFLNPVFGQTNLWKTYNAPTYSISYPESWEFSFLYENEHSIYLRPPNKDKRSSGSVGISLIIHDDNPRNTAPLDDYIREGEKQVPTLLIEGKIISSERIVTDSKTYHHLVYTGYAESDFTRKHLKKIEQNFYMLNQNLYILSYSAEDDLYEAYKADAAKIIDSFTFKVNK